MPLFYQLPQEETCNPPHN